MTRHPLMPIPDPSPVAAQPYIAGCRRDADHFHTWGRRRDHHDTARIMPLIGDNDASGECGGDQQRGNPRDNVRTHVGNQFFFERNLAPKRTRAQPGCKRYGRTTSKNSAEARKEHPPCWGTGRDEPR